MSAFYLYLGKFDLKKMKDIYLNKAQSYDRSSDVPCIDEIKNLLTSAWQVIHFSYIRFLKNKTDYYLLTHLESFESRTGI